MSKNILKPSAPDANTMLFWRAVRSVLKASPRLAAISLTKRLRIPRARGQVVDSRMNGRPCLVVLDPSSPLGGLLVPKTYLGFPVHCDDGHFDWPHWNRNSSANDGGKPRQGAIIDIVA